MEHLKGPQHEIAFWDNFIRKRWYRFTYHRSFRQHFAPMINGKEKVRVADIGCGGVPLTGTCWDGVEVEYLPSDLYAREYMKVWDEIGQSPLVPLEFQDMRALTYPDDSMDIVHCSNALDHCEDPVVSIKELVRICKPGGWVHLRHVAHEAKRRGYRGIHRWNLDLTPDNDCVIWSKAQGLLLSNVVPGFVNEVVIGPFGRGAEVIISNLHKE